MSEPTAPKPPTDWQAIEIEYRAGTKTLRLIGEQHGVSHTAIKKRAVKEEWDRDLTAKVKAREEALVSKALVSKMVSKTDLETKRVSETRHIEQLAHTKATVRIDHVVKIRRVMDVFMSLLGDLEVTCNPEGQGLIESLMDAANTPAGEETPEELTRRRKRQSDLLSKVLDIPDRIDSGKRVTEMLARLVDMERQAYGITDKDSVDTATRTFTDVERAHRLSAWLERVQARIAGETSDAEPVEP